MLANVAVDGVVGACTLVGDAFERGFGAPTSATCGFCMIGLNARSIGSRDVAPGRRSCDHIVRCETGD